MKNSMIISVLATFTLTIGSSFASNQINFPVTGTNPYTIHTLVDDPSIIQGEVAQYPGGETALNKFLQMNINYPRIAREQGIEGKVIVSFVIDENGDITNIKVEQGIGGGCEEEVVRVLSEMPSWKPTNQSGHAIKTKRLFSFNFQL